MEPHIRRRQHARPRVFVRRGVLLPEPRKDRVNLRARLFDGAAVGEPRLDEQPSRPTAIQTRQPRILIRRPLHAGEHQALRHRHRDPEITGHARHRSAESVRRDADHGVCHARDGHRFTDDAFAAAKLLLPQAVAEDDDRGTARGRCFLWEKSPTAADADPEQVEVICRDGLAGDEQRPMGDGENPPDKCMGGGALQRVDALDDIEKVRIGRGQLREVAARARVNLHEPVGLGQRDPAKEHRIDDGKQGGVEPDANRHRQNGDARQRWLLDELTHSQPEITEHDVGYGGRWRRVPLARMGRRSGACRLRAIRSSADGDRRERSRNAHG